MADITLNNSDNIRAGTNQADTILGRGGDDQLSGLGGNDTVNGGSGDDELNGGSGADSLNGGTGNDELDGGSGADTLNGGPDDDFLDGGGGSDLFLFGINDGFDTIEDFVPGEQIQLLDISTAEAQAIAASAGPNDVINDADQGVGAVDDGGDRFGGLIFIDFFDVAGGPGGGILTVEGVSALNLEIVGGDVFLT